MKIAIISHWGDGLALGLRLLREGHQVACYVKDEHYKANLSGAFPHTNDINKIVHWKPDFAFADQTELAGEMLFLTDKGILTFGGTLEHDKLEHKRFESLDLACQCGVSVPATFGFKPEQTKDAKKMLNNKFDYVIKFDKGDSMSSFVARNNEDIAHFLEQHPPKGPFILQERKECAVELNTEYWFSKGKFTGIAIGGLEQKKWLAGNLGQNVGCASNISWVYKNVPKIGKKLFTPKLLEYLQKINYSGPLDMAAIIDKDGKPWFIEFTPRLGYSAIYDMQELLQIDLGTFLAAIANGTTGMPKAFDHSLYGCSIPVSIAPYPNEWPSHYIADERIYADKPDVVEHFWPYDAKVIGNWEGYATAGTSGLLGYITASGEVPEAARELAMSRVKSLEVSDIQYRIDAGEQADKLKKLKELGYGVY